MAERRENEENGSGEDGPPAPKRSRGVRVLCDFMRSLQEQATEPEGINKVLEVCDATLAHFTCSISYIKVSSFSVWLGVNEF